MVEINGVCLRQAGPNLTRHLKLIASKWNPGLPSSRFRVIKIFDQSWEKRIWEIIERTFTNIERSKILSRTLPEPRTINVLSLMPCGLKSSFVHYSHGLSGNWYFEWALQGSNCKNILHINLGPLQDRSLAKTKGNKKVQLRTWVEGVQELGQVYNSEHILDASSVKFKTIVAKDKAIGMGELYKEYVWNGPSVW